MSLPGHFDAATRDERSAPFFDALGRGVLLLRRCVPDGHLSAPEVQFCSHCSSADLGWAPARGDGRIVSWTALHSRPDESGRTAIGPVIGLVELAEGPWLRARLLAVDPGEVHSGAPVAMTIVPTDGEPIYAFRLVTDPEPLE